MGRRQPTQHRPRELRRPRERVVAGQRDPDGDQQDCLFRPIAHGCGLQEVFRVAGGQHIGKNGANSIWNCLVLRDRLSRIRAIGIVDDEIERVWRCEMAEIPVFGPVPLGFPWADRFAARDQPLPAAKLRRHNQNGIVDKIAQFGAV